MTTFEYLVNEVLFHNSTDKNAICCIEEMSELTKVLTKKLRKSPKFNIDILTEEIAHVLLMCNVVARECGINENDILAVQEDAVNRMKNDI